MTILYSVHCIYSSEKAEHEVYTLLHSHLKEKKKKEVAFTALPVHEKSHGHGVEARQIPVSMPCVLRLVLGQTSWLNWAVFRVDMSEVGYEGSWCIASLYSSFSCSTALNKFKTCSNWELFWWLPRPFVSPGLPKGSNSRHFLRHPVQNLEWFILFPASFASCSRKIC